MTWSTFSYCVESHKWSPWEMDVPYYDSLGGYVDSFHATLQGGDPSEPGWMRQCRTCGKKEFR